METTGVPDMKKKTEQPTSLAIHRVKDEIEIRVER